MKKLSKAMIAVFLFSSVCILLADEYAPLKEGLSRTYSINGSTSKTVENFEERKLGKKKVTPQKIEINGATSFIFIQDTKKGQLLYAKQNEDQAEPEILDAEIYLNKGFKSGTTWERDFTTTLMMETVTFPVSYEVQKDKEIVTTPAATFKKCVKVVGKGETERDKGLLGTIKLTVTVTEWYAPDVGLIKSVVHKSGNHMLVGEEETITQLTKLTKP